MGDPAPQPRGHRKEWRAPAKIQAPLVTLACSSVLQGRMIEVVQADDSDGSNEPASCLLVLWAMGFAPHTCGKREGHGQTNEVLRVCKEM